METTVFLSNRSQAVRLPKAVALPENVKRVEVIAVGRTRIITQPERHGRMVRRTQRQRRFYG